MGHSGVRGGERERDRERKRERNISSAETRAERSYLVWLLQSTAARERERERESRRQVCQAKHPGAHSVSGAMIDQRGQLTSSWRRDLAALAGSRPSCQLIIYWENFGPPQNPLPSSRFGPRLAHQNVGKRNERRPASPQFNTTQHDEPRFLYPMHEYPLSTLLCQSTLNVHDGHPCV